MSLSNRFFDYLFSDFETDAILLWQLTGKKSHWFDDPKSAAEFANDKIDLYIGCGLRAEALPPPKRGGESDVAAIVGLWADVDCNHGVHTEKALPGMEDALQLILDMPLQPSIIVDSAGGLQPWWLLKEPWTFENDAERQRARQLSEAWQQLLLSTASKKNWKLDNTSDLARVLRIPGTFNGKFTPPRPVTFLEAPDNPLRYDPTDFEEYVTPRPAPVIDLKTRKKYEYPTPDAEIIFRRCPFLKHCRDDARTLPEPEWFAALSIVARCADGIEQAHEISKNYPKYTPDETNQKIKSVLEKGGPMLCETIAKRFGRQWCNACDYCGLVMTALQLAEIPPASDLPVVTVIPTADPPSGWELAKSAGENMEDVFDKPADIGKAELILAYRGVACGWPPQDTCNLLVAFHRLHGLTTKQAAYYSRKIAVATKLFERNQAGDELNEFYELGKSTTEPISDESERHARLDALNKITSKFRIISFIKYLSDPPSYGLIVEIAENKYEVDLGDDFMSQIKFRRAIAQQVNQIMPNIKTERWNSFIQGLLDIREELDIGDEATDLGALEAWLDRYINSCGLVDINDEKFKYNEFPFLKDGAIQITGNHFRNWLFPHTTENLSRPKLGKLFRKFGMRSHTVHVRGKAIKLWELKKTEIVNLLREN